MPDHSLIDDLQTGALAIPEFLAQIEKKFEEQEPFIHAFLPEESRFSRLQEEAESLIRSFPEPVNRPGLFGVLVGVKDIFHVEGYPTQAGSRLPAGVLQGGEAESVRRLIKAGALIVGKTITTEFAYFTPGPTRNPRHTDHTPGGSSSGSAAAVAAGFCQIALGTQTIGSVIRPASFCGVVGIKPTYDRISRAGVIPLSPSLDHVGFFTPNIQTAILTAPILYNSWNQLTHPLRKPRLGIPEGPLLKNTSEEGLIQFEKICRRLESAGFEIQSIQVMDNFDEIRARHDRILAAEAARFHAGWFEKYPMLYSAKFTELIQRGQQVTDEQLQAALTAREDFRVDMRRLFLDHDLDLWICPSTVGTAPKGLASTGDPVMNLPWTQAGLPAINLPAGLNQDQLPFGLQLIGNWYKDESLLFWAKGLEKVLSDL
jgi:Asp-tRNA(Asn)/Glu-tRNA(Gln) amidotransferase A subunit family amidase